MLSIADTLLLSAVSMLLKADAIESNAFKSICFQKQKKILPRIAKSKKASNSAFFARYFFKKHF